MSWFGNEGGITWLFYGFFSFEMMQRGFEFLATGCNGGHGVDWVIEASTGKSKKWAGFSWWQKGLGIFFCVFGRGGSASRSRVLLSSGVLLFFLLSSQAFSQLTALHL